MKIDYTNFLSSFMADESPWDDQIADNVIGVIFAARETTASVLTWIIKYLSDKPTVLAVVKVSKFFKTTIFTSRTANEALERQMAFL